MSVFLFAYCGGAKGGTETESFFVCLCVSQAVRRLLWSQGICACEYTYRFAFLRQNAMYETLHGADVETHGFAVGKGGAAVLQAAMTLM